MTDLNKMKPFNPSYPMPPASFNPDSQTDDVNDFDALAGFLPTREQAKKNVAAFTPDQKLYFPSIRKLKIKDVTKLAKIIGQNVGVLKNLLTKISAASDEERNGVSQEVMMSAIQEYAPKLASDVYQDIILDVIGLNDEQFQDLDLDAIEVLINLIAANNDIVGFIRMLSKQLAKATKTPSLTRSNALA